MSDNIRTTIYLKEDLIEKMDQKNKNEKFAQTRSKAIRKLIRNWINGKTESSDGRDWKTAFTAMYLFFQDCVKNIDLICPTDTNKINYNNFYSKQKEHFELISELGRLVANT